VRKLVDGEFVDLTPEEVTAREADEAADTARVTANKYKGDRCEAYGSIGDQLDMQYWDSVNDTTVWVDHIAAVKLANPKPD